MNAHRYRERGTAAIEMVLVLGFGIVLLAGTVLFGRLTMHMIAMEKAVGGTARIIAALPRPMLVADGAQNALPALGGAIVHDMAVSAGLDLAPRVSSVSVTCDEGFCGLGSAATSITIGTNVVFTDTVFGAYTATFMPPTGSLSLPFRYSQLCAPIPSNLP
jgi:Flp pilus assembly protein TadG